ncbi:hypothetical protein MBAV_001975 [Candidatus Magnetobacterium bavaricum]|uniref:Uncharacterized protein n=1 Tax=Candidatus Magnetobacterium bavaricum TaxID=29290 RepID=A0A0F3GVB2_9BACT|nr:hypothetical protein MBAV_001975 [Candidatus Magnetobacterium bavaricum]
MYGGIEIMTINLNKFDENRGAIYVDHELNDKGYGNVIDIMNDVKDRLIEAHQHALPELPRSLQYKYLDKCFYISGYS